MEKSFVPVRILDKKWALKFVGGEMFMRSLADFGIWKRFENLKNEQLNNNFRNDLGEGAFRTIVMPEDDEYFKQLNKALGGHLISGKLIDYGDIQYFNLLCMYCLHYFPLTGKYENPSQRLKEFGDTAIVITNLDAFFNRLFEKIERNNKYASLVNTVEYYRDDRTKNLNPMFNKHASFSWQNELRIAVGRLDKAHKLKNGKYPLMKDTSPLKFEIGNLSDITRLVPIEDFIKGNWDKTGLKHSSESLFLEQAFLKTNEIMSAYTPNEYNPMFIFG